MHHNKLKKIVCYLQQSIRPLKEPTGIRDEKYSKYPDTRTYDFKFQADKVLIPGQLTEYNQNVTRPQGECWEI